jgi:hypothetical protein
VAGEARIAADDAVMDEPSPTRPVRIVIALVRWRSERRPAEMADDRMRVAALFEAIEIGRVVLISTALSSARALV